MASSGTKPDPCKSFLFLSPAVQMYEYHSHFHRITATSIERIHKIVEHGTSIAEVIRDRISGVQAGRFSASLFATA